MRINFFEEYPIEKNMAKLDLVDWDSTVLLAAPALSEFENICEKYSTKYPHITFGWWPTIPGSYWVSGFSNPKDLDKLFSELTSKKHQRELPILIDMELPFKKYLYIKNIFNIGKNKKRIAKFFEEALNYNLKIYTAEYPAFNALNYKLWRALGISPSFKFKHIKLPMCYSSMLLKFLGKSILSQVKKFESKFARKNIGCVGFGLGTIEVGVLGNEPILPPEKLTQDLEWAKDSSVEEVFIFRLGGLNESFLKVIKGGLES